MLLEVLLLKGFYFINIAIFCKKHTIFLILLAKDSSMLNKEIGANLPSHSFFFKSTIYYIGHDGSPCLQEELCIEY